MESLIPIIAIFMVFGPPFYWIKRRFDLKEKTLRAGDGAHAGDAKQLEAAQSERKLLQARVENLEAIVTNVDYELNLRIAKLTSMSQMRALPDGDAPAAETPGTEASDPHRDIASDRTMTQGAKPQTAELARKAAVLRDASAPPLEIGQILGKRYRIDRLIGRGGMGAVYLADDEVLGEPVALKVISSAFSSDQRELGDRFRREASAARKISHANVIRIHDLGEADGGLLYLSMEYFQGKTLADLLTSRGALADRDVNDIVGQICDGLGAAHDAGVVHRDLKPQNVLVGERNAVKLIDFGLAKTAYMASMTATGIMLGTPYYMSPEQVRGKNVDARSDVYALGALTYHVVTGEPPFTGDNPISIGFAHCSDTARRPRELRAKISEALDTMIMAALEKDPRDRPHSASEFREALS